MGSKNRAKRAAKQKARERRRGYDDGTTTALDDDPEAFEQVLDDGPRRSPEVVADAVLALAHDGDSETALEWRDVLALPASSDVENVERGLELIEGSGIGGPLAGALEARDTGRLRVQAVPATINGERRMLRVYDVPMPDRGGRLFSAEGETMTLDSQRITRSIDAALVALHSFTLFNFVRIDRNRIIAFRTYNSHTHPPNFG